MLIKNSARIRVRLSVFGNSQKGSYKPTVKRRCRRRWRWRWRWSTVIPCSLVTAFQNSLQECSHLPNNVILTPSCRASGSVDVNRGVAAPSLSACPAHYSRTVFACDLEVLLSIFAICQASGATSHQLHTQSACKQVEPHKSQSARTGSREPRYLKIKIKRAPILSRSRLYQRPITKLARYMPLWK